VNSLGHSSFRLEYNDSIYFSQSGIISFVVFDTNVRNSITFDYRTPISISNSRVYAVSVSGSPVMHFRKNLSTSVSIFTIPADRCNTASQFVTGISTIDYTFESDSLSTVCLFPLSTHYCDSVHLSSSDSATFIVLNGSDEMSLPGPLLSVTAPYYIQFSNPQRIALSRSHSGRPEMNWNLCQADDFFCRFRVGDQETVHQWIAFDSLLTARR
jgi:hypothetical protein